VKNSGERRVETRFGIELQARFSIVSGEMEKKSRAVPGIVQNLSEKGFCLSTDFTIVDNLHVLVSKSGVAGNTLEIRIFLPDGKEILILGTACWYNLSNRKGTYRYDMGIRIDRLSEEDQLNLRQFLQKARRNRFHLPGIRWFERLFQRQKP